MSNKTVISNFNAIEDSNTLTHDNDQFQIFSKTSFQTFLIKLPKPPNKYKLKSAIQYYSSFAITADFCLVGTTEKKALKIIQLLKVLKLLSK